jgi:CHAT domain-containing protein
LSDFAVSSYSPSISALLKAQAGAKVMPCTLAKVLLVAEPNAPGLSALPNTTEEVESVTRVLPHGVILSSQNAASTVHKSDTKDLLELLPQASILHLACHGHQDPENPLNSGFMLGNGRLTISQLMQTRTPDAFLAFLSACETAKGAQKQPDQAVHLAAAMLFAGFKSIIGTMWGMGDADGPAVATHVYRELFRGEQLDPQVVPYALDEAVQALRQAGVSAHRWATFIHVGA